MVFPMPTGWSEAIIRTCPLNIREKTAIRPRVAINLQLVAIKTATKPDLTWFMDRRPGQPKSPSLALGTLHFLMMPLAS